MRACSARQPTARPDTARTHNTTNPVDLHDSIRKPVSALTEVVVLASQPSIMRLLALVLTLVLNAATGVHLLELAKITRNCNTVEYDKVLLKRVTLISKYVFTGKVFGVSSVNGSRVYKVNIRRVLKGDLNEIGVVRFGTAHSLRFSDATVLVESSHAFKCPTLRLRTYAIFLTEKHQEKGVLRLSLVVEPVLLTLRNIEIIEAAVKGRYSLCTRLRSLMPLIGLL